MKKRILAYLILTVMLFASCPAVATGNEVVLSVNVPDEHVKKGDAFTVTVELSNSPGIGALQMTLSYDSNLMECKDVILEEVAQTMLAVANPKAKTGAIVAGASATGVTIDGVVASFDFIAIENISEYNFSLVDITLADVVRKDIPYKIFVNSVQQELPSQSDKEDEDVPPKEEQGSTSKPSRPSGSGGSQGGTVTKPGKNEITSDPKDEGSVEEVFEQMEEITDEVMHLFGDTGDHWAEPYINRAVDAGVFKGDAEGNFNPDYNITRAQFITVLWRMAGSPETEVDVDVPFEDIANQIPEFRSAICWGYQNGYINGVSETAFNPEGTLTREAGMKILHYYSGGKTGNEFIFTNVYDNAFEDSKDISSWAKKSMYWGVYNKLISGITSNQLAPQGVATRAQIAKILVNYLESFNE